MLGFDFYRDPLGAMKPGMTFEEIYKADVAAKPKVMATQRKLLESRYDLEPKLDPAAKMSRGKPLAWGRPPGCRRGWTWDDAGRHEPGGDPPEGRLPVHGAASSRAGAGWAARSFPQMQIKMFPRLERLRRRVRPPRSLPARVPAGDVPAEPARAGRRLPRRGRLDQQLLPPVQGHPDAGAARRPAPAADAVPPGGVQPDRRPQERRAQPGRDLLRLPRQRPHHRAVPHQPRHPARSSGACAWTR